MVELDLQVTVAGAKIQPTTPTEAALTLRSPEGAPGAQAPLELMSAAATNPGSGQVNETFYWIYNRDGTNAEMPVWSERFDSRLEDDGTEYVQRSWEFTSLDRSVSYQPQRFRVSLADNRMTEEHVVKSWSILGLHDGVQSANPAYQFTTGNSDAEGLAVIRRPLVLWNDQSQLWLNTAAEGHRAELHMTGAQTYGVFELKPARYDTSTGLPLSLSYVNIYARRLELAADTGQPVGLSFRGSTSANDSVALRLNTASKILEVVGTGGADEPSSWSFNASGGQMFAAATVGVNTNTVAGLGGGSGVLAIGNAQTVPASNPSSGGVLYVQSGALKFRGAGGSVTTLAPA